MKGLITKDAEEGVLVSDENIQYALMALQASDDIAIDTETSGLNVRNNVDYCMGFCVDVPGFMGYLPFRHKTDNISMRYLPALIDVLREKPLIWHNRKFDMHSVTTLGINPLESFVGPQLDTLMMFQLWDEELFSKEMDFLAKRFLNTEKHDSANVHKMGDIYGYANIPPSIYRTYGSFDAHITRALFYFVWNKLVEQELDGVYWETEAPFTDLLYLIEQRGVGVHKDFCEEKASTGRGRMATISRELGINPASTKDLGKFLLEDLGLPTLAHTDSCDECKAIQKRGDNPQNFLHTHEGRASFNKRAMEDYDDILNAPTAAANFGSNVGAAKLINEYRGWQKATTSLYEPMLEKVGPDGLVRTEFKQHGTVTGRLSSSNPNLQQVPRASAKLWNGNAKSAFHSGRPGYVLYGWDYSQVELRLAAAYGQESVLLAEFAQDGADPFNVLAPLIFGILTPETRHDTKTFVYANLYGAGLPKIALQLGRPLSEVRGLYENYKRGIPGIINASSTVASVIESRGYVKYWDGRRRHFRNRKEGYKGWNSVCQGGAAQIVKKAMLRCREFEDENCFMVLQVHDEITFAIREDMIDHYEPLIVHAMTDWPQFGVRFAVDGKEWK